MCCNIISQLNTEKIQADTKLENYTVKLFHNTSLFRLPMGMACCKSLKKSLYLRVNFTLRALRITGVPDLYDFLSINVFYILSNKNLMKNILVYLFYLAPK